MPTEPPATLAGWLRTRSDEQLSALLVARPDVARPAPSDLVALASRLAVPVSVDRALDELDAATLQVLDVVLLAPTDGVAPDELIAALPDLPDDVLTEALERLTTRALLWGDDVLHAPDPVRRAVRHPAGLGRRAAELRVQLPADLEATIGELAPEERQVLERLAGERPVGHLPDSPTDAQTPARRLLQRGLLARIDALNVELPREIGLHLRGDRPYGPPRLRPEPAVAGHDQASVDRRAAGAALESVGKVGELLTLLEEEPAGLLRSGGVGVRDQKRLARTLHLGEAEAAWLLELAYAAGLLDVGGPHRDEWLPTRAYDVWREQDLADRWALLAAGWLGGVRLPSLVGQRDVAGKAVNPLSPDLTRHTAPAIRRSALTVLAEYPPGSGLAGGDLVALLRWRTPRRADRPPPAPGMLGAGGPARGVRGRRAVHGRPGPAPRRRGRRCRRHARAAAGTGRPRTRPARPLPRRTRAPGRRAGRHPRRRGRRRVLRRGDGLPGLGLQHPAGSGHRLVGLGPARLLHPRLPHAGPPGPGLPDRRCRPPARASPGGLHRVLRPLRRPRPAVPGAQRPADRLRGTPPAGPRRPGQPPGRRRGPHRAAGGRLRPGRGTSRRRRPDPPPGPAPRPRPASGHRVLSCTATTDHRRARRHRPPDARRGRGALGPTRRGRAPGARRDDRRDAGAALPRRPGGRRGVAGLRGRPGQRQPARGAPGVTGRRIPPGVRRAPRGEQHVRRAPDHLGGPR